ncbi:protein kinase [Streptomyces hygroscopicus]|uniref:serine/threonine-protein kinase n=1 Tax=Streptomyces hygroscopicus TaxID=1912 RepID=UPI00369E9060
MEDLGAEDPRWIGDYRLLRRLGAGGMGRVFLAHSSRGRTVAVKLVQTELAQQAEFRRRFKQEVRAAQRVGGTWTAPVLDADTEAATPWVATGYIAGPSLHAIVSQSGPLPERTVRILANGLTQALHDIHDAGLVHRDLKPSNVLVTIDGPRVIDFGIARALETVTDGILTRSGAVVGSPGFMSPEQVRGERVTPASDVFCLGSVLAYAATGRQPFGTVDSGVHAVMYRIAQEEPDLEGLPEGLHPLVTDCLKKSPDDRPSLEALLERTAGADEDTEPWLPGGLVAQLGRHAVQLLEVETPAGPGVPARPAEPGVPARPAGPPVAGAGGPAVPPPPSAPPSATSYPLAPAEPPTPPPPTTPPLPSAAPLPPAPSAPPSAGPGPSGAGQGGTARPGGHAAAPEVGAGQAAGAAAPDGPYAGTPSSHPGQAAAPQAGPGHDAPGPGAPYAAPPVAPVPSGGPSAAPQADTGQGAANHGTPGNATAPQAGAGAPSPGPRQTAGQAGPDHGAPARPGTPSAAPPPGAGPEAAPRAGTPGPDAHQETPGGAAASAAGTAHPGAAPGAAAASSDPRGAAEPGGAADPQGAAPYAGPAPSDANQGIADQAATGQGTAGRADAGQSTPPRAGATPAAAAASPDSPGSPGSPGTAAPYAAQTPAGQAPGPQAPAAQAPGAYGYPPHGTPPQAAAADGGASQTPPHAFGPPDVTSFGTAQDRAAATPSAGFGAPAGPGGPGGPGSPNGPGGAQRPKRRRKTLIALSAAVATLLIAGVAALVVVKGNDDKGDQAKTDYGKATHTPPDGPGPSGAQAPSSGSASPGPSATKLETTGDVPTEYLGAWEGEIKEDGEPTGKIRRVVLSQGPVGAVVAETLTSDADSFCQDSAKLKSADNLLLIEDQDVTTSIPEGSCSAVGEQTLRIGDDGTLAWSVPNSSSEATLRPSKSGGKPVPDTYLGTWLAKDAFGKTDATVKITIKQGAVGTAVAQDVADSKKYHCEGDRLLVSVEKGLVLSPSKFTGGTPKDLCGPGTSLTFTASGHDKLRVEYDDPDDYSDETMTQTFTRLD